MAISPSNYIHYRQCEFLEIDEGELDTSSLHARIVHSPSREALLSRQHLWPSLSPDTDIDDVTLLTDLSCLAPSVAKNFMLKSHADSTFTFRLINNVEFQGEESSFIAMSYSWKRVVRHTSRRIVTPLGDLPFGWQKEVEQFPLPTSGALFQAVLRERRKNEGLWFDQVCIDQENEMERMTTIGASDTIYKNARTVIVVLDDVLASPEEEQLLRYLFDQYSYSETQSQPEVGSHPPVMSQYSFLRSFFERVVSSTWFERAWCAHEMRSAQSHVFLVPTDTNYGDGIQNVIRFTGTFFLNLLALGSELHDFPRPISTRIRSLVEVFRFCDAASSFAVQHPGAPVPRIHQSPSLVSTFEEIFRMSTGGNPKLPEYLRRLDANRDKTSIALSASGLPLALAPASPFSRPYIEDECLRALLLVALVARDPVSLCTTGTPLQLHDGSISWLCRPTALDASESHSPIPRFNPTSSTITQSSDGRAEFAQLDLVFLELPHRSHPNPLFTTHVVRARTLIDYCIQHQVPGSGLWSFSRAPEHPRTAGLRNSFIQTLACIFACGPQWLLSVAPSLPRAHPPIPALDPYTLAALFNPHLALHTYLALPAAQTTASHLLSLLATLIATGIPWASRASERSHGPLLVSAPHPHPPRTPSPSPPHAYLAPAPPPKALVFAPFAHSRILLVAVPAALSAPVYSPLARAWILTTMHPFTGSAKAAVSWTLQGKGVVFGDEAFVRGLDAVGDAGVRRHRVYGPGR
ncbi:hypothetical protein ACN47E_002175 [Coniothyrium glycines]